MFFTFKSQFLITQSFFFLQKSNKQFIFIKQVLMKTMLNLHVYAYLWLFLLWASRVGFWKYKKCQLCKYLNRATLFFFNERIDQWHPLRDNITIFWKNKWILEVLCITVTLLCYLTFKLPPNNQVQYEVLLESIFANKSGAYIVESLLQNASYANSAAQPEPGPMYINCKGNNLPAWQ